MSRPFRAICFPQRVVGLLGVLAAGWMISAAHAESPLVDCLSRLAQFGIWSAFIVGGEATDDQPAVGLLTTMTKPATATLVGKRTVITAAHCIDEGFEHTFTIGGKSYAVASAIKHPNYVVREGQLVNNDPMQLADHDIAIIRLKEEPPVAPAVLNRGDLPLRTRLEILGFGETSLNRNDRGTKRKTTNQIAVASRAKYLFNGLGSICHGDSGGPSFARVNGRTVLTGVHSVVSNPCGNYGVDIRVDAYLEWLQREANGDLEIAPP